MEKFDVVSYPDYNKTRELLLETMPNTPMELIDIILEDIIDWNIYAKYPMNNIISNKDVTDFDLRIISGFKNINMLDISRSPNITDLSPLSNLNNIDMLAMYLCRNITDLSPLSNTNIRELWMSCCTGITDLFPLENIAELEILVLSGCNPRLDTTKLENRGVKIYW